MVRPRDPNKPIIPRRKRDISERFWEKVDKSGGPDACWVWTGQLSPAGYGKFSDRDRHLRSHRFAFELEGRPVPEHLVVDHMCRNRKCVNTKHLRWVTNAQNCLENSVGISAQNALKTYCKRGHPLSGNNLYVSPITGFRQCKTCVKQRGAQAYAKRKAQSE